MEFFIKIFYTYVGLLLLISWHEFLQTLKLTADLASKRAEGTCILKPKNTHKDELNNKHMTKQKGNNDPSSSLVMIKFTPK